MSDPATGAATPPAGRHGLPFVLRILGGCLVVAVVVGAGLTAERLTDDDLELPERVAGLAVDDSAEARDRYDYNDDRISNAYEGADAVSRLYGATSDSPLLVTAIEAESGPPLPTWFDDPRTLRLTAPLNELVDEGDVTCLLTRSPEPEDEEDPGPVAVLCQRTHGDLTVRVHGTQEPDVDRIVDATDEVWEELS